MDDVKEAYFEDLKEKNALVRSARAGTRKTKYWGKQYTKKELEQMNGPTYQVNLREPLAFADFKALPKNLQKDYLENIVKTYNVGPYTIAQVMSCSGPPLVAKMKEFGIETPKLTSHKASAKFLKDYGKPQPESDQTKKMTFCGASISFTGIYDEQSVLQQLRAIIPTDIPIKLAVSIDAAE